VTPSYLPVAHLYLVELTVRKVAVSMVELFQKKEYERNMKVAYCKK
jgi:hypothetical protein